MEKYLNLTLDDLKIRDNDFKKKVEKIVNDELVDLDDRVLINFAIYYDKVKKNPLTYLFSNDDCIVYMTFYTDSKLEYRLNNSHVIKKLKEYFKEIDLMIDDVRIQVIHDIRNFEKVNDSKYLNVVYHNKDFINNKINNVMESLPNSHDVLPSSNKEDNKLKPDWSKVAKYQDLSDYELKNKGDDNMFDIKSSIVIDESKKPVMTRIVEDIEEQIKIKFREKGKFTNFKLTEKLKIVGVYKYKAKRFINGSDEILCLLLDFNGEDVNSLGANIVDMIERIVRNKDVFKFDKLLIHDFNNLKKNYISEGCRKQYVLVKLIESVKEICIDNSYIDLYFDHERIDELLDRSIEDKIDNETIDITERYDLIDELEKKLKNLDFINGKLGFEVLGLITYKSKASGSVKLVDIFYTVDDDKQRMFQYETVIKNKEVINVINEVFPNMNIEWTSYTYIGDDLSYDDVLDKVELLEGKSIRAHFEIYYFDKERMKDVMGYNQRDNTNEDGVPPVLENVRIDIERKLHDEFEFEKPISILSLLYFERQLPLFLIKEDGERDQRAIVMGYYSKDIRPNEILHDNSDRLLEIINEFVDYDLNEVIPVAINILFDGFEAYKEYMSNSFEQYDFNYLYNRDDVIKSIFREEEEYSKEYQETVNRIDTFIKENSLLSHINTIVNDIEYIDEVILTYDKGTYYVRFINMKDRDRVTNRSVRIALFNDEKGLSTKGEIYNTPFCGKIEVISEIIDIKKDLLSTSDYGYDTVFVYEEVSEGVFKRHELRHSYSDDARHQRTNNYTKNKEDKNMPINVTEDNENSLDKLLKDVDISYNQKDLAIYVSNRVESITNKTVSVEALWYYTWENDTVLIKDRVGMKILINKELSISNYNRVEYRLKELINNKYNLCLDDIELIDPPEVDSGTINELHLWMLENMSNVYYYHPYYSDERKRERKINSEAEKVKELLSNLNKDDKVDVLTKVTDDLK